jgi:hypothetical protein
VWQIGIGAYPLAAVIFVRVAIAHEQGQSYNAGIALFEVAERLELLEDFVFRHLGGFPQSEPIADECVLPSHLRHFLPQSVQPGR